VNNLNKLRRENKLKQSDIANILKVSRVTVSGWERGLHQIDEKSLFFLADYFNVTIDYLLGRSKESALSEPSSRNVSQASSDEDDFLRGYHALAAEGKEHIWRTMFMAINSSSMPSDEEILLRTYRELSEKDKAHTRQTMNMALKAADISREEEELLRVYRDLSEQDKALARQTVATALKSTPVRVYRAARSRNNTEGGYVDMPTDVVKKIKALKRPAEKGDF
jgi:transcriptional regulator with XRE-family HTH domain